MRARTARLAILGSAACLIAVCLIALLAGCKGTGSCPDEAGIGRTIKVYEVNVAANAKSQVFIGTVGTQTPMYQAEEAFGTGSDAPYFTGGTMPASSGVNAGTSQGKFVQQTINDGNKRAAETDLATAATLASGLQQSNVGQTSPMTQREGTTTGTQTQTSSPQQNDATQFNPATNLSGQGAATQTPTSTLAGQSAAPGAVTGGTSSAQGDTGTTTTAATAALPDIAALTAAVTDAQQIADVVGRGGAADGSDTPAQTAAQNTLARARAALAAATGATSNTP